MERATMEQLLAAARAEAERSWGEGGIPVGAVLARENGMIVARGHTQRIQSSAATGGPKPGWPRPASPWSASMIRPAWR
jgi:tRNA(Arg) A34 adenosine deaminase TadA